MHVILTSDVTWGPTGLDNITLEDERWLHALSDHVENISPLFDIYVGYNRRHEVHNISLYRYDLGNGNIPVNDISYIINTSESSQSDVMQPSTLSTDTPPEYASHIPHFSWQSADIIKRKFDATTQYILALMSNLLKRYFKSSFPSLNSYLQKEVVTTDTIYSDVSSVTSGATKDQF